MEYLAPIIINIKDFKNTIVSKDFIIYKITDEDKSNYFWITDIPNEWNWFWFIDWKNKYWNHYNDFMLFGVDKLTFMTFLPKINYFVKIDNIGLLKSLFFSMRLYKSWKLDFIICMNSWTAWSYHINPTITKDEWIYTISNEEFIKIHELHEKVKTFFDSRKFYIETFNSIIDEKTNIYNSYFNCVSLIEWLLVKKWQDITFKFSLFSTFLLSKLWYEVSFDKMKKIYSNRCDIAHWENPKIKNEDLLEVINYSRAILKYFFENNFEINIEKELFGILEIN